MVLLSTRGGVPVLSFLMFIPSFIKDSDNPTAAASPNLPALYDFSPTEIQPPKLISENQFTRKYELSNGSTLLLTPNISNEIVAISIFANGGNFLQEKYGTSSLMADAMMKGTEKYSKTELAQLLEDNGIKIAPSVRSDAFSITVLTTKPEYKRTLEILNEIINNATFDDYEIEKIKEEKLNAIKKNRDIPLQVAIEEYKHMLFEGTPYTDRKSVV